MRMPTVSSYEVPTTIADKVFWLALRIFLGMATIAIALMAGLAFAQVPGAPAAAAQPAWLTVLLQLGPWLIGAVVSMHLVHKLSGVLRSDGVKRGGVLGKAEEVVADELDVVDDYLTQNKQNLVDMLDPAKRAAAEAGLKASGVVDAKAAIDAALKRSLPNG